MERNIIRLQNICRQKIDGIKGEMNVIACHLDRTVFLTILNIIGLLLNNMRMKLSLNESLSIGALIWKCLLCCSWKV